MLVILDNCFCTLSLLKLILELTKKTDIASIGKGARTYSDKTLLIENILKITNENKTEILIKYINFPEF